MSSRNDAIPPNSARSASRPSTLEGGPVHPLPPTEEFNRAAAELGLEFDPGDLDRLGQFLALLLRANQTMNLTAIRDPQAAWMRHVLDSLTLLQVVEGATISILDVGSGGGLPGIPLAIALPGSRVTLLEATGKKAAFLTEAAQRLGLANVTVVSSRAEKAGAEGSKHRDAYDLVTARAVGRTAVVAELCAPFAKPGGRVVLIKGEKAEEELLEAQPALAKLRLGHSGTIATPTGRLVVLEKIGATPRAFPRRDGEAKHAPIAKGPDR